VSSIFVSYRRIDSAGSAGRLYDRLSRRFGRDHVFMDTEGSIERGADFPEVIERAVASANAMVVVIGRQWLSCADATGNPRLHNSDDWVRNEVASALRRNILVLPVFVDGAVMPATEALPDDLSRLTRKQAAEISSTRWDYDVGQIIRILEKTTPASGNAFARYKKAIVAAIALIATVAAVAIGFRETYDTPATVPASSPADTAKPAATEIKAPSAPAAGTGTAARANAANDLRGYWQDDDGAMYKIVDREGGGYDMGRIEPPETNPVYRIVRINKRDVEIAIGVLPSGTQQGVANLELSVDGNLLAGLLKSTQIEDTPRNWVLRRRPDGPDKAATGKAGKT
jgi:hypothetical protein